MRVPGWLDVALEGGVTELQRALAETIAVRRVLRRNWRSHALTVGERCKALWQRQEAIERAIDRARKRARIDPRAKAALGLVERLEQERAQLRHDFEQLLGARGLSNDSAFRGVVDRAEGLSWFESGWRRFHLERRVLGGLLVALIAAIPFFCWLDASSWGFVPTLIDLHAIRQLPGYWFGLALLAAGGSVGWWRLGTWQWLGVRRGSLALPMMIGGPTALLFGALTLDAGVGLGFGGLAVALTLCLSCSYHAIWIPKANELVSPDEPVDPGVATEKTAA